MTPPKKLENSAQIVRYLESMSYFISYAKITEVYPGGFFFVVKVPTWYRWIMGRNLKKRIEFDLRERIYDSISFEFKIFSKEFF